MRAKNLSEVTSQRPKAQVARQRVATNRELLMVEREKMFETISWYSSDEIAAFHQFSSVHDSQIAYDLRNSHKIFGVKHGREWRHPKFQFDEAGKPHGEVAAIIQALPDDLGWSRLQWFLTPSAALGRNRPFDVWSSDRGRVVAAAQQEHWGERE